uniref:F-box domain-containing protein n=1 Tax=Caenorhabditis tropicalis TaxID=1561998 RepID=A0A1I7UD71_9PELO
MSIIPTFQFPLLKLPWVCIEHIINSSRAFDIFDLINFSLISKRCYLIVKGLKHRALKYYTIKIDKTFYEIGFGRNEQFVIGRWKFHLDDETNRLMQIYYINETDGEWVESKATRLLADNTESSVANSFNYVMNLFPRFIADIVFSDNVESEYMKRFDLFKGVNQCEHLFIKNETSELKELLTSIRTTCSLILTYPITENFRFDPDLMYAPVLRVDHCGTSHSKDIMLRSKSRSITIANCSLSQITPFDFRNFIMRWLNSTDNTFEMLQLIWAEAFEHVDFPEFFDVHDFDPNRRSQYIKFTLKKKLDLSQGYDIKRSDGLWATILVYRNKVLLFYVWHELFPDLSGLTPC